MRYECDVFEIAQRIVGGICTEKLRVGMCGHGAKKARISIGSRSDDMLSADDASATAHIFHDNRLSERRTHALGDDPRKHINGAACSSRYNHDHLATWIIVRPDDTTHQEQNNH
jgi:hypothetical protein